MCTEDVHTIVFPDGREEESRKVTRCEKAPRGYQCAQPRVFSYPKTYAADGRLPPTPRMTPSGGSPRPTTPLAYYSNSGGESSDHSRRSGGSGGSSGRRRDRYTTYHTSTDAAKVININHRSGPGRQERILIVENPPTPRTPPQAFAMPFTAPSSPRSGYTMASEHYARPGRRDTLRPVIVDERPINSSSRHVRFDPMGSPSSSTAAGHRRTHSNESRNSYSNSDDDRRYPPSASRRSLRQETADFVLFPEQDDAARRRERRRREKEAAAASAEPTPSEVRLDRDLRKAERIAHLNSSIDSRPAVPVPGLGRTATDAAAELRDRELRESLRNLDIGPAPLRRRGTGMTKEEEAQKRRLEERMMPRRRASVGPGARRGRVVYENGVYVWE